MLLLWGLLFGGLILLYFGAESLVKGSASLALRMGVSPLVVGLTVVAFGTSAPELVISAKAAQAGQGGIAAGNVIGSNIFNVAVILGVAALIRPMRIQMQVLRFDTPIMIAVSLGCGLLLLDGCVSRVEAAGLFAGIVAYTLANILMARRETNRAIAREFETGTPPRSRSLGIDALLIAGGLALLVFGARLFVGAASTLARHWGVSEAVIGLTIVAAGTSLPELVTSVVAALQKEDDIAIGNIIGSNVFNLLGILGVAGLIRPIDTAGVSRVDYAVMLGVALALVPLMRSQWKLARWEGALLLGSYLVYLWWLWPA